MYIANDLIKRVQACGENAAQRSRNISLAKIWEDLEAVDPKTIYQVKGDILTASINVAIPAEEPTTYTKCSTEKPLAVIGVDGSQIYPRQDMIRFGYVSAVAYSILSRPIYLADFVDLKAFYNHEIDRHDLAQLFRLVSSPKTFVDLWRTTIELQVGLQAVTQHPGRLLMMDNPLLPPKSREIGRGILIDRWTSWLLALKELNAMVAGITSGPSSMLLSSMIAISQTKSVWAARQTKENVSDRDLMNFGLQVGQRSAVFHYGSNRETPLREQGVGLDFFFLKPAKNEVMRVEIPQWVGDNPDAVDHVHASILEDCRPLGSYPFVLASAHFDIMIPANVSNDLYERAVHAFLSSGGVYTVSAKRLLKQNGYKNQSHT